MREPSRVEPSGAHAPVRARPDARTPAPTGSTSAPLIAARALQRAVGNRGTQRALARWAAHPDKDKKGVLMTDAAAGLYNSLNPPLSK